VRLAAQPVRPQGAGAPGDGAAPTRIFEIGVRTEPPTELLRRIIEFERDGPPRRVSYVNAHVLNQSRSNPGLRRALQSSDVVYCDGYGVRLAAELIGLPVPHRMTGADWIWALAALCEERGRSLYLLGSRPGVAAHAAAALQRSFPRLEVAGTHHGYFRIGSPHGERVLEHIAERRPDIVLVGMSTPLQELWAEREHDRIDAGVVWTVGALFDYLAGRTPRAPHWLSERGLEWIFRLAVEPRRMWRRYLLGNPAFLYRVLDERRRRNGSE
jgi:N-acetylglucosaminyldiphosphoundecaprenol N-acetyl-beta-D-mannosaminyltransferase